MSLYAVSEHADLKKIDPLLQAGSLLVSTLCWSLLFSAGSVMADTPPSLPKIPHQSIEAYREQVQAIAERAEQQLANPDPTVKQALESAKQTLDSPQYQQQKQHYRQVIQQQLMPDLAIPDASTTEVTTDAYPLLFISQSIPLQTLRNYVLPLKRAGGKMVLRGAVGGLDRMKPTVAFIASVLRKSPDCHGVHCELHPVEVLIDPLLFRDYGIHQVPALTMRRGEISHCEDSPLSDVERHVVYGVASLMALMDEYRALTH